MADESQVPSEDLVPDPQNSPPESNPVLDALAGRGLDVSGFETDDSVLEYLGEAHSRASSAPSQDEIERVNQLRPMVDDYASNAAEYQQWKAIRDKEPPVLEPEQKKWSAPQVSSSTTEMLDRGLIGRGDDGRLGVYNQVSGKYENDPRYARELGEAATYEQWNRDVGRRMASDPLGLLKEAGLEQEFSSRDDKLKQELREEIAQLRSMVTSQANQRQQETMSEQMDSLFAKGPNGHDYNRPTEKGKVYQQQAQRQYQILQNLGVTIDEDQMRQAAHQAGMDAAQDYDKTSGGKRQTRKQQQQTFIDKVEKRNGNSQLFNRLTNRDATVRTAAARESAQNEMDDGQIWDSSVRAATEEGLI